MTNEEPEAGVAVGPGRSEPAAETRQAEPARPSEPAATDSGESGPPPLTSADYSVAFSPRNVAIGLAIVAGIVAFVLSRRRRAGDDLGRTRSGTDEAD